MAAGAAARRLLRTAGWLTAVFLLPALGAGLWHLSGGGDGTAGSPAWPAVPDNELARLAVAEPAAVRPAPAALNSANPYHSCLPFRTWLLALHSTQQTRLDSGCGLVGGRWTGAFTGIAVTDPGDIALEPVIPLGHAVAAGLGGDPASLRRWLAPGRDDAWLWQPALPRAARARGGRGIADWLPPRRDLACLYARRWLAALARFGLTAAPRELQTLRRVLSGCGQIR